MAKGNAIIVSPNPMGRRWEGTINDTSKPGTCMQLDVSEGFDSNNRPDFEAYNADADGNQRPVMVLLEDSLQGTDATTAYTSGDAVQVYFPLPGDELNVLFQNDAGTADDVAFGDILIIDDGTGKVRATTGSPESEPFQSLEVYTDPTADKLLHCLFTGY